MIGRIPKLISHVHGWAQEHLANIPTIVLLFTLSFAGVARATMPADDVSGSPMQGFATAIAIGAGVAGILVFLMRFTRREVVTETSKASRQLERRYRRQRARLRREIQELSAQLAEHQKPCERRFTRLGVPIEIESKTDHEPET